MLPKRIEDSRCLPQDTKKKKKKARKNNKGSNR